MPCAVSKSRLIIAFALTLWLGPFAPAQAQTYPNRHIQLFVGYPAGGTGDIVGRMVGAKLAAVLGQSVVVENRAGAGGTLAAQALVNALPDGYTLMAAQTPEISVNPYFLKNVPYDPLKDMQPIALAAIVPLVLAVPGTAPYSTVADMLKNWESARNISFASGGTGTTGHLAGELLKFKTKANLVHVPCRGAGPALNDLIGAHVDFYFPGYAAALPHVKAGSLKMLAMASPKRLSVTPDIPTVTETTGIPNFNFTLWVGFVAPKGTPPEIVARLNAEINKIITTDPDVTKRLHDDGAEVAALSIEQFAAFMRAEAANYQQVIKDANLKPE
jgi:tripartite-type tricarboxylate transporter receptor subunit TctC